MTDLESSTSAEPRARFKTHTWAQSEFLESSAPELLYSGPLGSLKSRTLTEKADLRCRMHPGSRVALTRKMRVDLGLTTLKTLLESTITPRHKQWGWRPGADGGSTLNYPNGSQILCVGLDNPGKMFSAEFDLVLVDQCEEVSQEEWDGAQGRLRHRPQPDPTGRDAYRQIAGACNPADAAHFLFSRFRPDRGSHLQRSLEAIDLPTGEIVPAGTLTRQTITADPRDGRDLLPGDYLARLERFKGRYYERFVMGLWVSFTGSVYGDVWDASRLVVPRPASWLNGYPPASWPRYRAIDFGYTNPFVCQWWARGPDGCFWRYREIYMTQRTVAAHKRQMVEAEKKELTALNSCVTSPLHYLPVENSVSDHDAGDRAFLEDGDDGTGVSIVTTPADKDVRAGIQTVYLLMAPALDDAGHDHPRLQFVRDALIEVDETLVAQGLPTCTEEEIPRYRFQKHVDSVSTSGEREDPYKKDDHGCDATRYLFHTLRLGQTTESFSV